MFTCFITVLLHSYYDQAGGPSTAIWSDADVAVLEIDIALRSIVLPV